MPAKPIPVAERLLARVERSEAGCLVWLGAKNKFGYGVIGAGGRDAGNVLTHRVAWQAAFGAIPQGLYVLHHCDNPPCVAPEHLWLGTYADNNRDMWNKGRAGARRLRRGIGSNPRISSGTVQQIADAVGSYLGISKQFGVAAGTVARIHKRHQKLAGALNGGKPG